MHKSHRPTGLLPTLLSEGFSKMVLRSLEPASTVDESTLLEMHQRDLDTLFAEAPAGAVPIGVLDGVALLLPGRPVTRLVATVIQKLFWRGKVVEPSGHALRNRITPLDLRAIAAAVYLGQSRVDGRPCVVLDYSVTSVFASEVRDEIRLVAPGLYLGVIWLCGYRVGWFSLRVHRL